MISLDQGKINRRSVLAAGAIGIASPSLILKPSWAQGRHGGVLRIALYKDLRTINPIMSTFANESRATINLYNNLFSISSTGSLEYDLAETCDASNDAQTWTIRLRKNVKFHDGTPLEADDVVATVEKLIDPQTGSAYSQELGPVASVKALDTLTVRFDLKAPLADFPKNLTIFSARIISRKAINNFGTLDRTANGTGPFILREFVANDRIIMERNPNYFREGLPFLDRVEMRVLPDVNTQLAAFRNGEVDVIADVGTDSFAEVSKYRGVKALQVPSGTFNALVLFADRPPFDNPDVRMALKLSVDRQAMSEVVANGTGAPANDHPISANYEYMDKSQALLQPDLGRARNLLAKAGFKNGLEHRVVVPVSPASREKTAIVLQSMARQVGIHLNVELMDMPRYASTIWNKGTASYIANYSVRPTEDAILSKLFSAEGGTNEGRWASPESERMLAAARSSTNPGERRAIYAKFQQLARDTGPFVIGNFFNSLIATAGAVNDFPARAIVEATRLDGTWLSR